VPGYLPIGPVMIVTASVRNLVLELDGVAARDQVGMGRCVCVGGGECECE
jgi:hypothetical protein